MKISLDSVGKRFNREWLFRAFTYEFTTGNYYAITGPNGSGKSTLLQVIAGATLHNEGKIDYAIEDRVLPEDTIYRYISIAAPYLELIEEMTLFEFLDLHDKLKGWTETVNTTMIIKILGLQSSASKQLRYFSSGMKQRVKLAQAIFSNVKVILLDEPNTNLDTDGIELYHQLVQEYCKNQLVIVSSNDKNEYDFCNHLIDIQKYKVSPTLN